MATGKFDQQDVHVRLYQVYVSQDVRFIQHPDSSLMKETVDEVVKRFHAQMDHVPLLSLYDSDKDVALKLQTAYFKHHHT